MNSNPKRLRLNIGTVWSTSSARFAAYFFNDKTGQNTWVDMTATGTSGVYECTVPKGYEGVIFCRMKSSNTTNNWDNKYAQTLNIDLYSLCMSETRTHTLSNKLYFKPNSNWNSGGARFAAYFFGNGEKWVSMELDSDTGYYVCDIPSGYTKVIFCRMNGSQTTNNWDNKWNQTGDLTLRPNGSFVFDMPSDAAWDGSTYGWK